MKKLNELTYQQRLIAYFLSLLSLIAFMAFLGSVGSLDSFSPFHLFSSINSTNLTNSKNTDQAAHSQPYSQPSSLHSQEVQYSTVKRRTFSTEVYATGELDAENSTTVITTLRGDASKLIELIPDGSSVAKDDVIARIDPTPFEEKVNELSAKLQEQELYVTSLQKTYEREISQVEHDVQCAQYEVDTAKLELQKTVEGDGPLEMSRLKSLMSKAKSKCDDLSCYLCELEKLQSEDFALPGEITQCSKQLEQETEGYDIAKQQYDNYVAYLLPSMIKRAELNCQKAISHKQEVERAGQYRINNARITYEQAKQFHQRIRNQYNDAVAELARTELRAPTPGIVVHRAEFRGEKRRKPILGDILMRNQPLLEIPDLSQMIVKTKIREMDLHRVDLGHEASIEVDAFPGQVFSGKVSGIGILAQMDYTGNSREKCFEVMVRLDEANSKLRPGMTARVTIHSNHFKDVLSIPSHAIFTEDRHYYCYVKNGKWWGSKSVSSCEKREINVTPGNDQWAVVNSGLQEGEGVFLYSPNDGA